MANRYDEIFVATFGYGMDSISPPLTDEEKELYRLLWRERVMSEEAEKRDKYIYMSAVMRKGIDGLSPPPTSGEQLLYEKRCAYMRAEEARAKVEGRTFVWDVPYDR